MALAQIFSVAGTPAFLAGLLTWRFANLRTLGLVFKSSNTGFEYRESDLIRFEAQKALTRLRGAVQAIPLQELHLYCEDYSSGEEFFQTLMLAAGHPTLQHLVVDRACTRRGGQDRLDDLKQGTTASTSITSLDVRRFRKEDVKILRNALGALPKLSELSIDFRKTPADPLQTLKALAAGLNESITRLNVTSDSLRAPFWTNLPGSPNLRILTLDSSGGSNSKLQLGDLHLSQLEVIVANYHELDVYAHILRKAANRRLLPNLSRIHLHVKRRGQGWDAEEGRAVLLAYQDVVALGIEIRIIPANLGEMVLDKLARLNSISC